MTHDLTCRQVIDLLTELLDGALAARDRIAVEAHLAACPVCLRYLDQVRVTITVVGSLADEDVPADVREALVGAFRSWPRRDV